MYILMLFMIIAKTHIQKHINDQRINNRIADLKWDLIYFPLDAAAVQTQNLFISHGGLLVFEIHYLSEAIKLN